MAPIIERFHSRGQQLCKCIGTKESLHIRKEFNSHRIGLGHQHGRHFMTLLLFWNTDMAAMTSGSRSSRSVKAKPRDPIECTFNALLRKTKTAYGLANFFLFELMFADQKKKNTNSVKLYACKNS